MAYAGSKKGKSARAQLGPNGGIPAAWRRGAAGILTVFIVFSALAVIYSAYLYRQLFNEQQQMLQVRDELQVEWGQLLLEQSALAAHSRIETIVTKKLGMYVPAPNEIVVVRP
ncbi:MAG: cell division protein FtsL [Motiliproteus sp.]|nr:cell division protein FtsL [Motiliproteus sp.]MCW9051695.1 cell division protein FtsL [Motiliproteus sp.]